MAARHEAVAGLLAAVGRRHLLVRGANRSGWAVQWLTRWPVTAEAAVVVPPGEPDALFVPLHNHLPLARRLEELGRRGAGRDGVAWAGPLGVEQYPVLER